MFGSSSDARLCRAWSELGWDGFGSVRFGTGSSPSTSAFGRRRLFRSNSATLLILGRERREVVWFFERCTTCRVSSAGLVRGSDASLPASDLSDATLISGARPERNEWSRCCTVGCFTSLRTQPCVLRFKAEICTNPERAACRSDDLSVKLDPVLRRRRTNSSVDALEGI